MWVPIIEDALYKAAAKVIIILNSGGIIFEEHDLDICFLNLPQQPFPKPAVAVEDTEETEQSCLKPRTIEKKSVLTAGYTTKDHLGEDGNCRVISPTVFKARLPFMRWAIWTLTLFAGFTSSGADVEQYREGLLTSLMSEWVSMIWKGAC
ncbi:hypothetical protein QSH57_005082 [Fusarium oxysporum f. sp. vasinfectum]|nr:hypothetical protein QSH57_005082 [Fusarium oxysporum f. sp. vasinfectum]